LIASFHQFLFLLALPVAFGRRKKGATAHTVSQPPREGYDLMVAYVKPFVKGDALPHWLNFASSNRNFFPQNLFSLAKPSALCYTEKKPRGGSYVI
jgi:hypothetical protein